MVMEFLTGHWRERQFLKIVEQTYCGFRWWSKSKTWADSSGTQYNTQVGLSAFLGLFYNFTTFISHQRRSAAGKSQRPEKCCNRWRSGEKKKHTHTLHVSLEHPWVVFCYDALFFSCAQSVRCYVLNCRFNVFFYLRCFPFLITIDDRQICSVFLLILFLCVCFIKWIQVLWYLWDCVFFFLKSFRRE